MAKKYKIAALPKAQLGGTPTFNDSLALYNNALAKIKFYKNNPDYDIIYKGGTDFKNPTIRKKLIREIVKNNHNPNVNKWLVDEVIEKAKNKNQPLSAAQISQLKKQIGKKKFGKVSGTNLTSFGDVFDSSSDSYFNPLAPPIYLHPGITPQGSITYSSYRFGDVSDIPYYDPLAIKPAKLLTDAEIIKRYKKFGASGIPESRLKKLGLIGSENKPTTNKTVKETITKPVINKTVPKIIENKEINDSRPVLKTLPLKAIDTNREEPKVIPVEATNANRDNSIVPPQSVKQWKQNPATGTWYQIERPVNPMYSPKYNPGTGSYQGGGEKNDYIEIDADDTEIGDLIAQGYVVEQLPMAQDGYITASPISYHGDTPGLYRFDTQNPTFNVGYTQPLGSRAVNRLGVDAMSAGLTAKLPYMNNTGMGIQGNLHTDFDEWHNFPARMETDLSLGYDPKLGFHSGLIASPQFTFGNVQPTNSKVYGTGLKSGEFIANVGPFAGASAVPGRKTVEERFSMPAGVKGNIDFGIGRKGIKAGLSGYAGADLMGSGLESKSSESGLKPKFNYGIQANLKLPIKSTKEYFKDLLTQKEKQDRDYTPKIQYGGLPRAQVGLDNGVVKSKTPWAGAPKVTGDPNSAPVIYEGKDVTVKAKGPEWAGFQREYQSANPWERYLAGEKNKYIRKNKGLNKAAGVTASSFPKAAEDRIRAEYDRKMNTYITRRLGHQFGFNPRERGEWVDLLTEPEKKIVAGSKYASKLQPSIWSRTMSGAQESLNTIATVNPAAMAYSALTGKKAPRISNQKIPGYTEREMQEAKENPFEAAEVLSIMDLPAAYIANRAKNANVENPSFLSGEVMPNVTAGDLFISNPFFAADLAGLPLGLVTLGKTAASGIKNLSKGIKTIKIDDVADLAKTLPVQTRSYKGLPLRDIRTNEFKKLRNFTPLDEIAPQNYSKFDEYTLTNSRLESPYDIGEVNLTPGTEAHNAYETMRLNALGVEGPPAPNIRTKPHRWKDIDKTDIELSKYPKEELDAFGLGQGEIPFSELKGERPLTDPNYLENLKAAKDRALKNGDEDLAKIYDDLIEKSKITDLGRFTESYTGSDAMKELGKERLNMFEPTPGEEYAMLTKDLDPTNTKKEVYQTISDAIEDTRANKIEKWQTDEGKRRLQNMIDTTPYLKELGMTPESYVDSLVNLENANKTYLEKLMDVDEINEKILNLDKQYDLGNIEEQAYWNQIMDLESQVLSKRNEIADIRGDINRSGKYNAFMEATNRIAIGENINPFDLKQTIEHEISHLLQAGNKTSLDKELSKLKLIEDDEFGDIPGTYRVGEIGWLDYINSPAYIDEAKDYFRHGSEGQEKLAMVSELRQDLLDRGIIKDLYDKITPEMLQKHFDKYMGKGTGKKSIPLRVYDIMEDEESNFKVLASVLNKLPMLIPAIGTGVAVGVGAQDTGTKSLGQAGAYQFKYGGSVGHKLRKFIN